MKAVWASMYKSFESWEHYSGVKEFPVPRTAGCKDPELAESAYRLGVNTAAEDPDGFRYNQNTEYGRLRLSLLEHTLINYKTSYKV